MRILLFSDGLYPELIGGIERRNADLAAALARRGHAVTLAGFGRSVPAPGVRVISLGERRPLYAASGARLTRPAIELARAAWRIPIGEYDVVETSNVPFAHLFPLAARCAAARKPLLVSWYEYWGKYWNAYAGFRGPIFRTVEWISAQIGSVVASSALTAERLARRRLRPGIPVVPCGTDIDEIAAATAGIAEEPGRIIYAGRLLAHKRVDLLLEAVAGLPRARLVVYGDGPARPALVELARRLRIEDRVEFRAPSPDRAELWREIRRSAVAAQPSAREGFGIFPLEAIAAGVPVVFLRSVDSAVEEVVRPEIEGIRAEPDPRSLGEALGRLLDDADARAEMGARGRERAKEYRADRSAAEIEGVLAKAGRPGSAV
jgi:glycosyltransferase involved in cell wall biosynthesis